MNTNSLTSVIVFMIIKQCRILRLTFYLTALGDYMLNSFIVKISDNLGIFDCVTACWVIFHTFVVLC